MAWAHAEGGTRLFYEFVGAGDPLLLVNSQARDHHMWDRVVADFSAHHKIVLVDLRGTGASDKPDVPPYSTQGFAADLVAVMDAAGIRRAHAYGFSMGGRVCQWLGIEYAERIGALVLGATTPGDAHGIARAADADAVLSAPPSPESVRRMVKLMYGSDWIADHPEVLVPGAGDLAARAAPALSGQPVSRRVGPAARDHRADTADPRQRRSRQPDREHAAHGRGDLRLADVHRGRSAARVLRGVPHTVLPRRLGVPGAAPDPLEVNALVGSTSVDFVWDPKMARYVGTVGGQQITAADGTVVAKPNVLVQYCQVTADRSDIDGNPSMYTIQWDLVVLCCSGAASGLRAPGREPAMAPPRSSRTAPANRCCSPREAPSWPWYARGHPPDRQ